MTVFLDGSHLSRRSAARLRRIRRRGIPELVALVEGQSLSLAAGARLAGYAPEKQRGLLNLYRGRLRDLAADLARGRLALPASRRRKPSQADQEKDVVPRSAPVAPGKAAKAEAKLRAGWNAGEPVSDRLVLWREDSRLW